MPPPPHSVHIVAFVPPSAAIAAMHSDPGSLDRTGNTAWEARHRCVGAAVGDAGSGYCMQVGQPASLLCLSNNTCINQVFGASPAPPRFTAVAPQTLPLLPAEPARARTARASPHR
jgi:hypothetical protein